MTPEEKEILSSSVREIISKYLADPDNFQLDLSALDLRIKMKGDRWGGVVDKPVAKFILDLDRRLHEELARVGVELPATKHGVLALRIEEGSLEAFLEYAKGIFAEIRKMKPAVQIMVLVTVLGVFGIVMAPDIIEQLNEADLEEIRAQERVELVKAVGAISENSRELQQPMRGLLSTAAKDDEVYLPGSATPMKAQEVKKTLAKSTRSRYYNYQIDFPYIVQDLSFKATGEWEIGLAVGDLGFRAKLLLTEDQISELLQNFQDAHKRNSVIAPDLHITAEVNDKGVRAATVVGVGPARDGAVRLSEALAKEKARAEDLKAREAADQDAGVDGDQ